MPIRLPAHQRLGFAEEVMMAMGKVGLCHCASAPGEQSVVTVELGTILVRSNDVPNRA